MAASAVFRRVRQISVDSTKFKELIALNAAIHANSVFPNRLYSSLSSNLRYASRYSDTKHISQLVQSNGKRLFLVDTLALVIFSIFGYFFKNQFCLLFCISINSIALIDMCG